MQRYFEKTDAYAHRLHVQQLADHLKEHPPPRAATPPKRPPGRPPLKRPIADVLASAAAAAESLAAASADSKKARGPYTRWFNTEHIDQIILAYARHGSGRRTVAALVKSNPAVFTPITHHG